MSVQPKSRLLIIAAVLILVMLAGAALVTAQKLPSSVTPGQGANISDDSGDETPASPADAQLTEAEAIAIAEAERGSTATFVELEREGGLVIYSIDQADGSEVEVDASSGAIVEVELADGNDD